MSAEDPSSYSDRELLIRIDTKLEGVIADKKDHEARIRKLEEARITMDDKINRAVTPTQLWVGAGGAVAAASAVTTIISTLVNR